MIKFFGFQRRVDSQVNVLFNPEDGDRMIVIDDNDDDAVHVSQKIGITPSTFQNYKSQNIQNNFDTCFEWMKMWVKYLNLRSTK